ncbi:MAG: DUF2922 family protein [Clostridia bacterium]|nr:DUF2922 family protein [Clostridia bacterium]
MAVTLKLGYKDALGKSMIKTFSNIDEDVTDANVKALSAGLITNGAIFANPPVSAESAELITTTTKEIDLD